MSIARPKYMAHIRPNDESQDYIVLNDMDVDRLMADRKCQVCGDNVFRKLTAEAIEDGFIHLKCGGKCGRETIILVL